MENIIEQINKEELIKAGVHFGHPTSKLNPKFKEFTNTTAKKWYTSVLRWYSVVRNVVGTRRTTFLQYVANISQSHQ